jgi:repressor LexA
MDNTYASSVVTKRQKQVLRVLYDHINGSGFPPTLAELRDEMNVVSNQGVLDILFALENKKCIKREEGSARAIKILDHGFKELGVNVLIPVVGDTSCGAFVEAIEQSGTWQVVSDEIERLEQVYFVKARGDSMIGAGIDDGDLVLIRDSKEFTSGKIVLAEHPCYGTTIKRFIYQNKSPYRYLKPENPKYEIIIFTKNVRLKAIALKVFKKSGEIINLA